MGDKAATPAFLRRAAAPGPVSQKLEDHPRVREFFNEYVTERERQRELAEQLEIAEREIDKLQGRVGYLQQELGRATYKRDEYQAGYSELKAQLAVIMSTAAASLKSVIEVIESAVTTSRERMDDVERPQAPPPPDVVEGLEQGIKRIAERFGANARTEAEQAPPTKEELG